MLSKRPGRLLALVRLLFVPAAFAVVVTSDIPHGFATCAWVTAIAFAFSAAVLGFTALIPLSRAARTRLRVLAIAADGAVAIGFAFAFAFESGEPLRTLYLVPPIESALRFGVLGGVVAAVLVMPFVVGLELVHAHYLAMPTSWGGIAVRCAIALLTGAIVGQLRSELQRQRAEAEARATEAEALRDQLGHRLDVLEAANRCARALESSLVLEEAFAAFIREVGHVVRFDRTAVVLADGDEVEVLAAAGTGADTTLSPQSRRPIAGSIAEATLRGEVIYRGDISDPVDADERALLELGLLSRLTVPLLVGARSIGYMSLTRREPHAFGAEEVELITLLGRIAGTALQNIRAFEAERRTADELRRLSALRADFVSLVSHELRSPMAAVIGAARTLQARWRELKAEQRESFLALIGDETNRLASLIGDVLDTSRIEAGTFSYSFDDVDIGEVVEDLAATAALAQDEVAVVAKVAAQLPPVRGDRDRLRQVVSNLIENAVKYSSAGGEVEVRASTSNGAVRVAVRDDGPGIAHDQQGLIFEKFGRAKNPAGTPGSGLGLFIARSIAEAHGGTLDVHSAPGAGATFTLELPAERR
jgi:signal transduction histidine kinase